MGADSFEKPCCCAKRKASVIADDAGQESFLASVLPNWTLGEPKKDCCQRPAVARSHVPQLAVHAGCGTIMTAELSARI